MNIREDLLKTITLEQVALSRLRAAVGKEYEDAVRLIYQCPEKVVVTGVGKSGLIAQKIASTMVSTGTPALFLHPAEGMHGDVGIVRNADIVIAISKSGESDELIGLLPSITWCLGGSRLGSFPRSAISRKPARRSRRC